MTDIDFPCGRGSSAYRLAPPLETRGDDGADAVATETYLQVNTNRSRRKQWTGPRITSSWRGVVDAALQCRNDQRLTGVGLGAMPMDETAARRCRRCHKKPAYPPTPWRPRTLSLCMVAYTVVVLPPLHLSACLSFCLPSLCLCLLHALASVGFG